MDFKKDITIILIIALAIYLLAAFVNTSFNIQDFGEHGRVICVICFVGASSIYGMVKHF